MTTKEYIEGVKNVCDIYLKEDIRGEDPVDFLMILVRHLVRRDEKALPVLSRRINNLAVQQSEKFIREHTIIRERAIYLRDYLSGDMYNNEEAARENLPLQIEHAEKILELTEE